MYPLHILSSLPSYAMQANQMLNAVFHREPSGFLQRTQCLGISRARKNVYPRVWLSVWLIEIYFTKKMLLSRGAGLTKNLFSWKKFYFAVPSRHSLPLSSYYVFLIQKLKKKVAGTEKCGWRAPEPPPLEMPARTSLLKWLFKFVPGGTWAF